MRPWNIGEQVIVEPTTKLRFEFTSVHSQCMARGEEPPEHDRAVVLNVYNEGGSRVIRMDFSRGGQLVASTVEPVEEGVPQSEQEKVAEMVRDMTDELQDPPADRAGINVAGQFASDI